MKEMSTYWAQLKMWRSKIMGNEDLTDCIPYYLLPRLKCVDIPKDGKTKRRERRKQQLKKKKGRL